MFITPITKITSLDNLAGLSQATKADNTPAGAVPFKSLFQEAVGSVNEANNAVNEETYKLVTGQSANPDDLTIASTKLSLSTELFIQIRNKALDAYNEVMRMGV